MKTARENSSTRRHGSRPRLFMSYRRRFDTPYARLLKEKLERAFGDDAVFRDVDDIEPGEAFPETIREAVEDCDAFLLLVSPGWLETTGSLQDPADFVRREITAALARRVTIIPLLLGDARMPKADELPEEIRDLAFRQAIELSDDRWDYDVERLVKLVRARAALSEPPSFFGKIVAGFRWFFGTRPGKAAAFVAAVAGLLLAATALMLYAIRYERTRNLESCLGFYGPDVLGGVETVRAGEYDVPVVKGEQYQRAAGGRYEPDGLGVIVKLADSGKEVGAVILRFHRNDIHDESTFAVERVIEPPCTDVQDYGNDSLPAADKHFLKSWNSLRVRLGGRNYHLRVGDHGDYVMATLSPTPGQ